MILYLSCLFLLIVAILLVVNTICKKIVLPHWLFTAALWTITICGVAIVLLSVLRIASAGSAAANKETYDTLTLYRDVVESSKDELLRYDFYNRVNEWNDDYAAHSRILNNKWIGIIASPNAYNNCDIVLFELRRS